MLTKIPEAWRRFKSVSEVSLLGLVCSPDGHHTSTANAGSISGCPSLIGAAGQSCWPLRTPFSTVELVRRIKRNPSVLQLPETQETNKSLKSQDNTIHKQVPVQNNTSQLQPVQLLTRIGHSCLTSSFLALNYPREQTRISFRAFFSFSFSHMCELINHPGLLSKSLKSQGITEKLS